MGRFPILVCALALCIAGCQGTQAPPSDPVPADPDHAVAQIRDSWFAAPAETPYSGFRGQSSRAMLRRQAENLVFRYPQHADANMLCGVMAYEAGDPIEAGRYLDQVLRLRPASPDAALLRSRIAVEAGNVILAQRLLEEQVRLRPDHAGVRETLASVRFMEDDVEGARASLAQAEQLGADAARLAYNRGLLAEQDGDLGAAAGHYQQASDLQPGWAMPRERLKGVGGATAGSAPKTASSGLGTHEPVALVPAMPPPAPPLPVRSSPGSSSELPFPADR